MTTFTKLVSALLLMVFVSLPAKAQDTSIEYTEGPFSICAAALAEAGNGNGYIIDSTITKKRNEVFADYAAYYFVYGAMLFRFQIEENGRSFSCRIGSPKK